MKKTTEKGNNIIINMIKSVAKAYLSCYNYQLE